MVKEIHPPPSKRSFNTPMMEFVYVCKKLRYWLYIRKDCKAASRYLMRLKELLNIVSKGETFILRAEACSLLNEIEGNLRQAIKFRKREIELIEMLHQEASAEHHSQETREYMLQDRDEDCLMERKAILQSLEERERSN